MRRGVVASMCRHTGASTRTRLDTLCRYPTPTRRHRHVGARQGPIPTRWLILARRLPRRCTTHRHRRVRAPTRPRPQRVRTNDDAAVLTTSAAPHVAPCHEFRWPCKSTLRPIQTVVSISRPCRGIGAASARNAGVDAIPESVQAAWRKCQGRHSPDGERCRFHSRGKFHLGLVGNYHDGEQTADN